MLQPISGWLIIIKKIKEYILLAKLTFRIIFLVWTTILWKKWKVNRVLNVPQDNKKTLINLLNKYTIENMFTKNIKINWKKKKIL